MPTETKPQEITPPESVVPVYLVPLTAEELEARNAQEAAAESQKTLRRAAMRAAYGAEADPLFFQWQRGEVEREAWLEKVEEIKARYPDAGEW